MFFLHLFKLFLLLLCIFWVLLCFLFFHALYHQDGELNVPLPTACLLLWGSGSNCIQRASAWVEIKSSFQSWPTSDTEESYVCWKVSVQRRKRPYAHPMQIHDYSSFCPENKVLLYHRLWSLYLLLWSVWNVGVGTWNSISSIFLGL